MPRMCFCIISEVFSSVMYRQISRIYRLLFASSYSNITVCVIELLYFQEGRGTYLCCCTHMRGNITIMCFGCA